MPLINTVSVPRFGSILSKLFGIKERSVAPTLGTEILPTFDVGDPHAPENRWLRGERLWYCHTDTSVAAAPNTYQPNIAIGNPDGSNMLTVITGLEASVPDDAAAKVLVVYAVLIPGALAGGTVAFPSGWLAAGYTNSNTVCARDTRWSTNAGGNLGLNTLSLRGGNNVNPPAGAGGSILFTGNMANFESGTPIAPPLDYVYGPGRDIVLRPGSCLNVLIYRNSEFPSTSFYACVEAWGYERPLEDSEVRPGSS